MKLVKTLSVCTLALSTAFLFACGGGGSDNGSSTGTNSGTGAGTNTGTGAGTGNGTGTDTGTGTGNSGGPTASGFAYIVQAATNAGDEESLNFVGGSIQKCRVDATGILSSCTNQANVPGLKNPISIAITDQNAYIINQIAYDPDFGTGKGGQYPVIKCNVSSTTGELSGCDNGSEWLETEWALEIAASGANGYVLKKHQLLRCANGFTEKCGDDGGAVLGDSVDATDLTFANGRAYVLNTGTGSSPASILSWNVDAASGTLSGQRTVSDASLAAALAGDRPAGMAIFGATAYVASSYSNHVIECAYSASANTITGCIASTAALPALSIGAMQTGIATRGNYVFVTHSSLTTNGNAVVKCTIGSNGKLGSCTAETAPAFSTRIQDLKFAGS